MGREVRKHPPARWLSPPKKEDRHVHRSTRHRHAHSRPRRAPRCGPRYALGRPGRCLVGRLTDTEQRFLTEDELAVNKLVDLTVETLDPKDMLKKYARLGAECLRVARKRKAGFKAWSKDDFESLCDELAKKVKLRVAVKEVRMAVYVRTALWVEAVRPMVPGVEKLSYYQVANKFLPTLQFDPVELTGEVRKDWHVWVANTVAQQLGDEPLSIKALDESIAARKAEIDREKLAKKDPEKVLEQERKAAESKARAERKQAQARIGESIDKALVADHAGPADIVGIVEAVMKDHGLSLPKVGFDPATCGAADCKLVADVMFTSGKLVEMKYLRDRLDAMIKIAENALIATKTA